MARKRQWSDMYDLVVIGKEAHEKLTTARSGSRMTFSDMRNSRTMQSQQSTLSSNSELQIELQASSSFSESGSINEDDTSKSDNGKKQPIEVYQI